MVRGYFLLKEGDSSYPEFTVFTYNKHGQLSFSNPIENMTRHFKPFTATFRSLYIKNKRLSVYTPRQKVGLEDE